MKAQVRMLRVRCINYCFAISVDFDFYDLVQCAYVLSGKLYPGILMNCILRNGLRYL
jgi:hypothetical protein